MELVKYNNNSISSVTALGSLSSGDLNLIATNNITSGVSSSSFTSNINSTYDTYIFKFINIHPASDNVSFQFNGTDDSSSHSFDIIKTTTAFNAYHSESDSEASLGYRSADDVAQGTGYHTLSHQASNDNDNGLSGTLHLFNPSNTTFIKNFIARISGNNEDNHAQDNYSAGYFNTTSAITGLDFKFSSGNIDSGIIKMYGLSKS
tara:strand:+ start:473 stop:1087 length:615 start_codon:yes stop_codon:yes gene_type:complete